MRPGRRNAWSSESGMLEASIISMRYFGGVFGRMPRILRTLLLKNPRGFFSRRVRKILGMRPKTPPKYRMLMMLASNMPDSLDQAFLRPGRIDRIYKVG